MSETTVTASYSGIGFMGLLTIVLLVLKVLGHLQCSWFYVFLPVMVGPAILLLLLLGGAFIGLIYLLILAGRWLLNKIKN